MNTHKNIFFFIALFCSLSTRASAGDLGQLFTVNGLTQETYQWGTPLPKGQ